MRSSRQLSITLPNGTADEVRGRVATGRYARESEVVRGGLRALADQERAVDDWLRGPVMREYAAWEAGELDTVSLDAFKAELEQDRVAGS